MSCLVEVANNAHASVVQAFNQNKDSKVGASLMRLSSLAHLITKTREDDYMASSLRNHLKLDSGNVSVKDMIKSVLKTDDWRTIMKSDDPEVATTLDVHTDMIMKIAIEAGAKPGDFAEDNDLTTIFMERYEPYISSQRMTRAFGKAFAGEWARPIIRMFSEKAAREFDGFISQKDKQFRENPDLDPKRTKQRLVINDAEAGAKEITNKVANLFLDHPSTIVSIPMFNSLLRYMDADMQRSSYDSYGDNTTMLKNALEVEHNISKKDIPQALKDISKVYSAWQELNYGVKGDLTIENEMASTKEGFYNPRETGNSVLGYMYKTGDRIVEQLLSSGVPYSALDKAQKFYLEKFGDANAEEIAKKFPEITIDPMKIRKGYVPMGEATELVTLVESIGKKDMINSLDMMGERVAVNKDADIPFQDALARNIELLRHVATDVSRYTFSQAVKHYVLNTATDGHNQFKNWKDRRGDGNHEMESEMYDRYWRYIEQRFQDKTDITKRNASKGFQYAKKWAIMALSLQGTMPLADSAANNIIQAFIARFNTISGSDWANMHKSNKNAINSNDKDLQEIAALVQTKTVNKVMARRAAMVVRKEDLIENSKGLEEATTVQDTVIKAGFDLAEAAMSYGHLLPILPFIKGFNKVFNGTWNTPERLRDNMVSMTGTEMWIRNFNSKVAMNQISSMYKVQRDTKQTDFTKIDKEKWVNDALKGFEYHFDRLDQELHGDFSKDTKPFSAYMVGDAESTRDLLVGIGTAQFQMFRQATQFGLLGSAGSLAKVFALAKSGNTSTKMPGTVAASIILVDAMYEMYMDLVADNPIRLGALNAVNQIDPLIGMGEGLYMMMAPLFDLKVTQEQFDGMTEKFTRLGTGMLRGRLSDEESDKPFFEQLKGVLNLATITGKMLEPASLTFDMITEGVTVNNAATFKKRMRDMSTGVGMIDNIFTSGNDAVRFWLKTVMAGSSFLTDARYKDKGKQAYQTVNLGESLILSKLGLNMYSFENNIGPLMNNNASSLVTQKNLYSQVRDGHMPEPKDAKEMLQWYNDNDSETNPYMRQ